MQTIEFIIDTNGKIHIETSGFEGAACAETTEKLVLSLKGKVLEEEQKPEYWSDANAYLYAQNVPGTK